ncbi:hypothetical protein HJC23_006428 [Cyclotella cryptica]|uniref:Uncharacterized protein n=1 Tax=Cyclotella cryptica TaxID=29204 RepID=A0ABD3QV06_9STRA
MEAVCPLFVITRRTPSLHLSSSSRRHKLRRLGVRRSEFSWSMPASHVDMEVILSQTPCRSTFMNDISSAYDSMILSTNADDVEVLSTQDIIIGTVLAFLLALGYSYLSGQSSSSNFVLWRMDGGKSAPSSQPLDVRSPSNSTVFNETSWREMSRRENYVLYTTRIRGKKVTQRGGVENPASHQSLENRFVLLTLLALFLPIFFIETFFALSRQFLCESGLFGGSFHANEFAETLCSPFFQGG